MEGSEPVVIRNTTTVDEARILVAVLQGEGIPAYVQGDTLMDEFAVSRRATNLLGVRVLVPATSAARAAEVLANLQVDDGELEAQALAAPVDPAAQVEPRAEVAAAPPRASGLLIAWAVSASLAALVLLALWMAERERIDPLEERLQNGTRWRRPDGSIERDVLWRDDGSAEQRLFDADGLVVQSEQFRRNGKLARRDVFAAGLHVQWEFGDDGLPQSMKVLGDDGQLLKRQRFDGRNGWVDDPR